MSNISNERAFPVESQGFSARGLTKREYFAAMALQGVLANGASIVVLPRAEDAAANALIYADALLRMLSLPEIPK